MHIALQVFFKPKNIFSKSYFNNFKSTFKRPLYCSHQFRILKNDFTIVSDKEISFRDCTKIPMPEVTDTKVEAAANQEMPSAPVMLRLILIMVGRKLSRNPNTYSSVLGLVWSLISFKWAKLSSDTFLIILLNSSINYSNLHTRACQFMIIISFMFQVGCRDAEFGEIFHKIDIRCGSGDGYVQFRYIILQHKHMQMNIINRRKTIISNFF